MQLSEINAIIKQGESETIEFKKSTTQLKPAMETLCAFLNTKGGKVILGVDASGQLIGQDISDSTLQEISRELRKIEPTPEIGIHTIPILKKRNLIILQVKENNHIPYVYDGRPYERLQTTTCKMTQHRYEQLLIKRGQLNHAWEDLPALDYSINDLDHDEIKRTVKEGVSAARITREALVDSPEEILIRFNLLKEGQLTNAAVILFAKEMKSFYLHSMIRMARFRGIHITDEFIDNRQVYGNLFTLLSEADIFIRRHLPIAGLFQSDQFMRMDKPALPMISVRKALINAICHRDYSQTNSSISLAIYDDRMEIWNNGFLIKPITLDNLKEKHNSYPRNKKIAQILYARGLIETWGTGILKILNACKEANIPEPEFSEYSGGLEVLFRFAEPIGAMNIIKSDLLTFLSPRKKEIINYLTASPKLKAEEILAKLSFSISDRTLRRELTDLKNKGLVISHGRGASAVWMPNNAKGKEE